MLFWLVIVIILGIIELITVNLVSIWFIASGIIALISSLFIDNIVIDKTDTGSLDIKQINFRSSFIDKAVKLTQVGAYDYKLPFEVNHKQEMVLVSSPMKRKQVNKYLGYLREYFEIEYREDKGDRIENGMAVFDSAIPDNYELLKVIPIIDINLFKGKDITFGLVFRPTIKEIINEK